MTKEELYKVTDILNDVLSNYLRGSEAEEVIAKLEESVEDSELMQKEPVSEASLEEAAELFIDSLIPTEVDTVTPFAAEYVIELLNKAIKFGANWQKQKDKFILRELYNIANQEDGCLALENLQLRLSELTREDR